VRILVIGGGPVGQLFKCAVPSAEVFDFRPPPSADVATTTRSWGANYLWRPVPGIPCRGFQVITHIDGEEATPKTIHAYKTKVGKGDESRQDWEQQFRTYTQGFEMIRPPEIDINWNSQIGAIYFQDQEVWMESTKMIEKYDALIATLPLYSTLAMCGLMRDPEPWRSSPIYVKVMQRPPDARFPVEQMYVNYISDPNESVYRVTDREGQRHYEGLKEYPFGATAKKLVPGKIYPHTKSEYYRNMLKKFNIFTFGRYGSWNTSELMHETWDEIVEWRESFIPNYAG
jgi:hypothetical protein